jgi:hypothetical protein
LTNIGPTDAGVWSPARVTSAASIVAICVVFAAWGPRANAGYVFEDQAVSLGIITRMKAGSGFYSAANASMIAAKIGPVSSARSFRMPTIYLVWRWLPAPPALWIVFVMMVGATTLLLWSRTTAPLAAVVACVYLLGAGRQLFTGLWLMVEFWPLLPAAGFVWAWRLERWRAAAVFAVVAFLIRELAAGLVVGGLLASWRSGLPVRRWLIGVGLCCLAIGAHWWLASGYLVAHGREARLIGSESLPISITGMMGFLLPRGTWLGPLLWILAVIRLVRSKSVMFLGPYLALPLAGFVVYRPYWGLLVIPVMFILAGEELLWWGMLVRRRLAKPPRP